MRASILVSIVLLSASAFAQTEPVSSAGPSGHWEGAISMPEGDVKFTADIEKSGTGAWIGAISVVGTTAIDVPLDRFEVSGSSAKFHAGLLENPTFSGTLSPDGATFAGEVANARGAVPFHLIRRGSGRVNVPAPSTPFAEAKEIEGSWVGEIRAGEKTLHLDLIIGAGEGGLLSATLRNVDQGNLTIPITTTTFRDQELRFESRAISGAFAGKLAADRTIAGEWTQGPQKLALVFKRPTS